MNYTLTFDTNGKMISANAYDELPEQLPENEHVCTGRQYGFAPFCTLADGQIVLNEDSTLTTEKTNKLAELNKACSVAIMAGFPSTALGATYIYPSDMADQQNLASSVLASLLPLATNDPSWVTPFLCADVNGVWGYRDHTIEQIQQVGMDAKAAVLTNLGKKAYLAYQVQAATTVDEVDAIVWH